MQCEVNSSVHYWMSLFIVNINIEEPGVGPSLCMIFFLYLLLCMNFFSWHFPLHEFYFVFFPTPPITFLMVRPLKLLNLQENIITLTSFVTCHYIVLHPVSSRSSWASGLRVLIPHSWPIDCRNI